MSKFATVVFLTSALWAVSASAEEASKLFEQIAVPVDYQGRQIQLTGWLEKPAGAGPFPVVIALHSCTGYTAEMHVGAFPRWVPILKVQGYAVFKFDSFYGARL
jgi:poly(3-hydroxybutyrate) depolymerase